MKNNDLVRWSSVFSASAGALLLSRTAPVRGEPSRPDSSLRSWWSNLPRLKRGDGLVTGVIGLL
jgi:hypothetical protein